jgi:hypothetical protein
VSGQTSSRQALPPKPGPAREPKIKDARGHSGDQREPVGVALERLANGAGRRGQVAVLSLDICGQGNLIPCVQ